MSYYVRTLDATGQVVEWGSEALGAPPADHTDYTLGAPGALAGTPATRSAPGAGGIPQQYCKVDTGVVVEMSAGEKTAVDAAAPTYTLADLNATLDVGPLHFPVSVQATPIAAGVLTLDLTGTQKGDILLDQTITGVVVVMPPGEANLVVKVHQGAGVLYALPATQAAWSSGAAVKFAGGDAGAPVMGALSSWITLYIHTNGTTADVSAAGPFNV